MFRHKLRQLLDKFPSLPLNYLLIVTLLHWLQRSRRDLIINNNNNNNNTYVQLYVCI